jgi:Protein of unknown function (DUF3179)
VTTRLAHVLASLAAVAVLLLAVAGGSSGDRLARELARIGEDVEEELAMSGPAVGLGEASPPPARSEEWKTDFSRALVPLAEFQSGGPSKDGIPAIDEPRFTPAGGVDWLEGAEPVILVEAGGETKGYPLQILIWHEIVNDEIGGVPVAVTFCPLCNTAIVFDRRLDGEVYSFGTTGKLRESDLVMYDRQTESWWQQFGGEALVGELAGKELDQLPARIVSWDELRRDHAQASVLDRDTGFVREYGANPYPGYDSIDSPPIFATRNEDDDRLPPKERVVYVELGGAALAVPYSSLRESRTISVKTGAGELVVRWRPRIGSPLDEAAVAGGRSVGAATVTLDGRKVPFSEPFWFAVAALSSNVQIVDRSS